MVVCMFETNFHYLPYLIDFCLRLAFDLNAIVGLEGDDEVGHCHFAFSVEGFNAGVAESWRRGLWRSLMPPRGTLKVLPSSSYAGTVGYIFSAFSIG